MSKNRNFQDLKAIATATVDQFSNFNMPRVAKLKGYPKKILKKNSEKKILFAPHKYFSNFRKKNFFEKKKILKLSFRLAYRIKKNHQNPFSSSLDQF